MADLDTWHALGPSLERLAAAELEWPAATGERASDVIGEALTQLSERTGVARDELPPSPLDDEPVLVLTDAAEAIEGLADEDG